MGSYDRSRSTLYNYGYMSERLCFRYTDFRRFFHCAMCSFTHIADKYQQPCSGTLEFLLDCEMYGCGTFERSMFHRPANPIICNMCENFLRMRFAFCIH